jgi:hypothetical protein
VVQEGGTRQARRGGKWAAGCVGRARWREPACRPGRGCGAPGGIQRPKAQTAGGATRATYQADVTSQADIPGDLPGWYSTGQRDVYAAWGHCGVLRAAG